MEVEMGMEKMMNGSDPCQVKLFRPRKEKVCIWQSEYFFRIHVRLLLSLASYANRVPANSGVFCFSLVLEFERVYLDNLPSAAMYERSYMHRDVITHIVCTK